MRPLPAAAATGSLTSLLVSVAREAFSRADPILAPVVTAVEESCPIFSDPTWQLDNTSLLLGILIGVLIGPIIDLLFYLRHFWLDLFRAQARQIRPAYRVVG